MLMLAESWQGQFTRLLEVQPWPGACAFGESDANLAYLVPFHGRHRPGQTLPFDLVANYGLATDFVGDEAPQWLIAFHVIQLQTIECSNRAKFGVAFQHEIAEETQVLTTLGRLAEQLAESWQILFMADHTEQIVSLQACATGRVEQITATKQRGDTSAFGHVQLTQGCADAPFFCAKATDEQLPLAGWVHFQAGT